MEVGSLSTEIYTWGDSIHQYLTEKEAMGLCDYTNNASCTTSIVQTFWYTSHAGTHFSILLPGIRALKPSSRQLIYRTELRRPSDGTNPWNLTSFATLAYIMQSSTLINGKLHGTESLFVQLRLDNFMSNPFTP